MLTSTLSEVIALGMKTGVGDRRHRMPTVRMRSFIPQVPVSIVADLERV